MIYAALFPCNRLEPASELFGYPIQVIDLIEKFNLRAGGYGPIASFYPIELTEAMKDALYG
jgi:hypothetical protein